LLAWENRRLDRKWGQVDQETQEKARNGQIEEADANVGEENYGKTFRYVL